MKIIKAITWNIKAGKNYNGKYPRFKAKNLDKIARVIIESNASIVCLQEVDILTLRSGGIHQLEFIKSTLENKTERPWHYCFAPSLKLLSGYYGNAIISRFSISPISKVKLPKINTSENRCFLLTRVKLGTSYVYIGTFHLGLKGEQIPHSKKIKEFLYNIGYVNKKLLIGGDLNDIKNSDAYNIMQNYKFTMDDLGPYDICTFQCYKNNHNKKVDFWFGQNISVDSSKSQVLKTDISDHRPVVIEFTI